VQSTTRYPTPVINCVGDFSSLREAGLKGGKGLLGVTRRKSRALRFSSGLSVTRHYSDFCLIRRRDAKVPSAKIILPLSLQSVTWGPDQKLLQGR